MFYLRTVDFSGVQSNQQLGKGYYLYKPSSDRPLQSSTFYEILVERGFDENSMGTVEGESYIFAVIAGEEETVPLWSDRVYYVMTDSGATFAKLTHKQ